VAAARAVPCAGHVRARRDGVRALRARRRRVRVPGDRAGVVAVQERQRRRVRLDRAGGGPPAAGARRVAEARRTAARGDAGFHDEPERGRGAVRGADRRGRAVRVRGRGRRRRSAAREEPELRRRRGGSRTVTGRWWRWDDLLAVRPSASLAISASVRVGSCRATGSWCQTSIM
jgi:hypothetical protein